jgi:uncharacterized membrane protein YczE
MRRGTWPRHARGAREIGPASRSEEVGLARRFGQLAIGLIAYGLSLSLIVIARLGVDPWDVFQQGLARHTGIAIGTWSILVGVAVLTLWIPLHQRLGVGTLCNVLVIGLVMDVVLATIPRPHVLWLRVVALLGGILLNGIATGCYIGAHLGPGPRDGIMIGLAGRGHSIRVVRTALEATVVLAGFLLGGNVGIGTLAYASCIGPLAHVFIPGFDSQVRAQRSGHRSAELAEPGRAGQIL